MIAGVNLTGDTRRAAAAVSQRQWDIILQALTGDAVQNFKL